MNSWFSFVDGSHLTDAPAETHTPPHGQPPPPRSGLPFARHPFVIVVPFVDGFPHRRAHQNPQPAAGGQRIFNG
ncbi:MAG: hypothetical protein HY867_06890 [Chloroflexi bacterium]|nr:hypothetical protein [Chloroflexota bacterium]